MITYKDEAKAYRIISDELNKTAKPYANVDKVVERLSRKIPKIAQDLSKNNFNLQISYQGLLHHALYDLSAPI